MKLKNILLTVLAVAAFSISARAQEVYEYCTVFTRALTYVMVVDKDGMKSTKVTKEQWLEQEVIKKVNELSAVGWEVYNANASYTGGTEEERVTYFLRRKVKG